MIHEVDLIDACPEEEACERHKRFFAQWTPSVQVVAP